MANDSNLRIWTKNLYLRTVNVCDILVCWLVVCKRERIEIGQGKKEDNEEKEEEVKEKKKIK